MSGSIKLQVYVLNNIPFPDPDDMTEEQRKRLRKCSDNLINGEYNDIADVVMLDYLGIDNITVDELKEMFNTMVTARVENIDYDVLIQKNNINQEASVFEEHE